MYTIYDVLNTVEQQNQSKLLNSIRVTFLKAILAGMFIGIGGTAAIKVSNKFLPSDGLGPVLSSFVFTIGFVLIITLGVQLFTSNNLMTLNLLSKKAKALHVIRNWSIVWIGNLIGTFLIAVLLYYANGYNDIELEYITHLVEKKVHFEFLSAVLLGIGCNMIIVLTVFLVSATDDYFAKVFVAIFGVMIFLLCGFEHVVANMYYLSLGVLSGEFTVVTVLVHNLLPVTLGNLLGGAVIIPVLFYYTYKK